MVPSGEDACLICGFDLPACAEQFRFDPPSLEFLMDPTGRVPRDQWESLHARRDALVTRFPQLDFSFCLVALKDGQDVAEFGFWLFNSAPGAGESRAWRILVAVDLRVGEVALTPGYAIEPFLDPAGWTEALGMLAGHGADERWADGIEEFLDRAGRLLEKAGAEREQSGTATPDPHFDDPQ